MAYLVTEPIDPGQPVDLFEGEDRLARQPDVFLLRHAVPAAHVAAIRNGDSETPKRTAEYVSDSWVASHYEALQGPKQSRGLPDSRDCFGGYAPSQ